MTKWFSHHRYQLFVLVMCGWYVYFLWQYYFLSYYVFDFSHYYELAIATYIGYGEFVSRDGFSTLFLKLASYSAIYPAGLHLLSLLLQTFGIFSVIYWLPKILGQREVTKYLFAIFVFSCGFIYYFYGKLFYDFPFTFATYGLGLYFFWKYYKADTIHKKKWLAVIVLTFGFCLSWKPYNLFLIVGLIGLLWCYVVTRKTIISTLNNQAIGWWIQYPLWGILGFCIGNYSIFRFPVETLLGIRSYAAQSDPVSFFFRSEDWIIWDHVNSLAFNSSSLLILTLVMLVVITIIIKQWRYLFLLSSIVGAFSLFIYYFSPGYPWHGFPLALFLVTYFVFILKEFELSSFSAITRNILWMVIASCILIQGSYNFFVYIPRQDHWHDVTQKMITVIERQRSAIIHDIDSLIATTNGSVVVDLAVKRQLPKLTTFSRYYRIDPLVQQESIYEELYTQLDPDYIIYVEPAGFRELGDIADVTKYDQRPLISSIAGDGYKVILYSNR